MTFILLGISIGNLKRPRAEDDLDAVRKSKLAIMSPSAAGTPSRYKLLQGEGSQKILDDRPEADFVPPVSLLYGGFGHFLDEYHSARPMDSTQRDLEYNVDCFAKNMAEFHADEELRMSKGLRILNNILGIVLMAAAIGKVRTDGHYLGPHEAAVCVVEFKNELAQISSIPMVELTSYVAHSQRQSLDRHEALYKGWNVPCLGLTVVGKTNSSLLFKVFSDAKYILLLGPYVTFYGIIFLGQ